MNLTKLAVVALAALLVTAGAAAAVPGSENAQASDHRQDDTHRQDDEMHSEPAENASARADARPSVGERDPDASLPEQVPDHVTQIHSLADRFLRGELGGPSATPSATSRRTTRTRRVADPDSAFI